MNRIPERRRPLIVIAASLAVLLVIAGGVLLIGRLAPTPTPTPTPTTLPTSSSTATPSLDRSTPEGAVRAFFDTFAQARRTNDPSLILPLTTGEDSSAYRSIGAFLRGQKEVGKASITTVLRLEDFLVATSGDRSTVTFNLTEGGYDIGLDSGEPLESPQILPTTHVTVELAEADGRWLVERYRSEQ
ncbi:MAG: hypothetical protein H0U52_02015 [Chloroflexi bacterium]|nr:hypothetical protein [Chloroflexota bacterium]